MEDHRDQRYVEADFTGARFRGVVFEDVVISDAIVDGVDLSGNVRSLTVNGVEVASYVEAELDRRHPERVLLRADDPDGLRAAWSAAERWSAATIERARALPPEALDEQVGGEFSFLETLRHLVFATDRWISQAVLGEEHPFHPVGRPNDPIEEIPPGLVDLDRRPTLDELVEIRAGRMDRVRRVLADATLADLEREVPAPYGGTTTVRRCLHVVLREEWWHDRYANRDLSVLLSRAGR